MRHFLLVALAVLGLSIATQPIALHAQTKAAAKAMTASGTVKSVTGTSLVVTGKGKKDWTFTVDNATKFTGKGLTTKSQGAPMAATAAVHEGDMVSVSYHDMGGTMHAASVRITRAAMSTKK
jgi:hypothetical protein